MKVQIKASGTKEEALESLDKQMADGHPELFEVFAKLIHMQEGPKVDLTVIGDARSFSVQLISYS